MHKQHSLYHTSDLIGCFAIEHCVIIVWNRTLRGRCNVVAINPVFVDQSSPNLEYL